MTDFSARPTEGAPTKKVDCPLIGEDGNAFFIMGRLDKALQRAGASPEYRKAVQDDMTSGDYDHLLAVAIRETEWPKSEPKAERKAQPRTMEDAGWVEQDCPTCGKPSGHYDTEEGVGMDECEECMDTHDTFDFVMGLRR